MKRNWAGFGIVVVGVVLLILCSWSAGCSPTQQAWADRGMQGVDNARANQTAWYEAEVANINKDRKRSIQIAYAELTSAIANGYHPAELDLEATTQTATGTQPSGPIYRASAATRPVDANWITAQQRVLLATMQAYDDRKADVDAKYQVAMRNLDGIAESFTQISRLNRAWAQDSAQLSSEIDKLSAVVSSLQANAAAKKQSLIGEIIPSIPELAFCGLALCSSLYTRRRSRRVGGRRFLADDAAGSGPGSTSAGVPQKIIDAVGEAWAIYKIEHPMQASDVEAEFSDQENLVVGMQEALSENQSYVDLIAQTNDETTVAGLAKTLAPLLETAVEKFLGI